MVVHLRPEGAPSRRCAHTRRRVGERADAGCRGMRGREPRTGPRSCGGGSTKEVLALTRPSDREGGREEGSQNARGREGEGCEGRARGGRARRAALPR
eukprot:5124140-Prymnesium_polylepis.1